MIKNLILFIILFSSAEFFRIVLLSENLIYLIQFGIVGLLFVLIIINHIYGRQEMIKANFTFQVSLILTGVILSMISANAYHGQGLVITIWAQRFMYFYVFYFFLHFMQPDPRDLEKVLLAIGVIYVISYFIQFIAYPANLFDVRQDDDRGTIRIFLPGASFLSLSLFMCLYRFYTTNKLSYILLTLTFFAILVLQGTRNFLASAVLVIIISLIFSQTIRSRYVIYGLVILAAIPVYFLFHDIFIGMIELSERQSENIESDIRIRAATFFLTDFFPNKLSYFFGNGQHHGSSSYGLRMTAYSLAHGYYQADVGIIGDFSKFGLFYVAGYLWMLIKAFRTRLNPEHGYFKYYILLAFFTMPFGTTGASSIAVMSAILYIIDHDIHIREASASSPPG